LLVPALALVVTVAIACTREKRNRLLIPEGHAGWLCVSYGVGGAPELPNEDGFRLIVFPASGVVTTSTRGLSGEGYTDQYFYYSEGDGENSIFERNSAGDTPKLNSSGPSRTTNMRSNSG
jgi:uncharacterized protein DUF6843